MKSIHFKVVKSYVSPYPEPIPFQKGEYVHIGHEFNGNPEWKDWIRCRGQNGQEAWIPEQYLEIDGETGCLNRDYDALELSIKPGEVVRVFEILNGFAVAQKADGSRGWVPLNHLECINKTER